MSTSMNAPGAVEATAGGAAIVVVALLVTAIGRDCPVALSNCSAGDRLVTGWQL